MKLSVSLPDHDIEFVDQYARSQGLSSRSAVLRRAVRLLRGADLGSAYEDAFAEWEGTDGAADWDRTVRDGLDADAAR
jgi:Arc/MetJ-type ribon-helix-helix transcriptional regulator